MFFKKKKLLKFLLKIINIKKQVVTSHKNKNPANAFKFKKNRINVLIQSINIIFDKKLIKLFELNNIISDINNRIMNIESIDV